MNFLISMWAKFLFKRRYLNVPAWDRVNVNWRKVTCHVDDDGIAEQVQRPEVERFPEELEALLQRDWNLWHQ